MVKAASAKRAQRRRGSVTPTREHIPLPRTTPTGATGATGATPNTRLPGSGSSDPDLPNKPLIIFPSTPELAAGRTRSKSFGSAGGSASGSGAGADSRHDAESNGRSKELVYEKIRQSWSANGKATSRLSGAPPHRTSLDSKPPPPPPTSSSSLGASASADGGRRINSVINIAGEADLEISAGHFSYLQSREQALQYQQQKQQLKQQQQKQRAGSAGSAAGSTFSKKLAEATTAVVGPAKATDKSYSGAFDLQTRRRSNSGSASSAGTAAAAAATAGGGGGGGGLAGPGDGALRTPERKRNHATGSGATGEAADDQSPPYPPIPSSSSSTPARVNAALHPSATPLTSGIQVAFRKFDAELQPGRK